jgi:hypothetical protein
MSNPAEEIRAIWPYQQPGGAIPFPRRPVGPCTERGIGLRGSTRFPVLVCEGPHAAHCHALELSATGIVVDRGRELSERELRAGFKLELFVPATTRPVRVLAKVARTIVPGIYAFKFVLISDVDRLTLMEHLDHQRSGSLQSLGEIEAGAA